MRGVLKRLVFITCHRLSADIYSLLSDVRAREARTECCSIGLMRTTGVEFLLVERRKNNITKGALTEKPTTGNEQNRS